MHCDAKCHDIVKRAASQTRRLSSILGAFALVVALTVWPGSVRAEVPAPGIKLYVFDLGWLKARDPKVLTDRGVTVTNMSVVAYLIVHPRGTLLWDSGTIPDELVKPEGTVVARATVSKTLSGQLAEIGYKPSDITYFALSHYHYDHSANANAFAGSVWLVQAPERAAMFPDTPPANPIEPDVVAKFSALKTAKTKLLDGDYDVFGDGSVVIISTPGHTGASVAVCQARQVRTAGAIRRPLSLSLRTHAARFPPVPRPRRRRPGGDLKGEGRGVGEQGGGDAVDPARHHQRQTSK
jgi:N-acyl homoserine lactone hydrolase